MDSFFGMADAQEMTKPLRNIEEIDILDDEGRRGLAPEIILNPRFTVALNKAHINISHVLSVQLQFGVNLFHEMKNAAARSGE